MEISKKEDLDIVASNTTVTIVKATVEEVGDLLRGDKWPNYPYRRITLRVQTAAIDLVLFEEDAEHFSEKFSSASVGAQVVVREVVIEDDVSADAGDTTDTDGSSKIRARRLVAKRNTTIEAVGKEEDEQVDQEDSSAKAEKAQDQTESLLSFE